MYEVVKELIGHEVIPEFYKVDYSMPFQKIENIPDCIDRELNREHVIDRILPGDRVAITAGSREITNIVCILRTIANAVKRCGATPYIVAAMGSHGGATDEGQLAVLEGYGITPEAVGCEIVSHMETVFVGKTENGIDACIDAFAAKCDKIIVVGRVKVHTDFHGSVESGLAKMIAIGLGKQHGADLCHKLGFPQMSENVRQISRTVCANMPITFGVAIVEDAFHNTAELTAVPVERFETEEPVILERARKLMPRIPFDKIDILIVTEIGKNISGAGMDPNITGRSPRLGVCSPYAERLAVLRIHELSHGAGTGIGNADAITKRAYDAFDFNITYPNGITSNDPESIKIPAVMPSDKHAIQFVISVLMGEWENRIPRIVWIQNTSALEHFYISSALVDTAKKTPCLKITSGALEALFDEEGWMNGFRTVTE